MPMITVKYVSDDAGPELRGRIAIAATDVAARTLGKSADVTIVLAEAAARDSWFVGGAPLKVGVSAFWLQIAVTAGTNTKVETTAFVREAFSAMSRTLGQVDERSYVLVHAAEGDSYGYGGRTQNARWAESQAR